MPVTQDPPLSDREVWRRLDAALVILGSELARGQQATDCLSAARLIVAGALAVMSPENRVAPAEDGPNTTGRILRLPVSDDFAASLAAFQRDNPELDTIEKTIAYIAGAYLAETGYFSPSPPI